MWGTQQCGWWMKRELRYFYLNSRNETQIDNWRWESWENIDGDCLRRMIWNLTLLSPRQPTATLTTDGPACDRAPCAMWTPCTCDTMCKVQVVNMWHNVPTKPPPNLFSYWSAVINCVHPLWIKCPHKPINEMDLIREAWKGLNLMSSTEKDFDRSETKGQWSRKEVGPVFVELKGFGEWLIAYGCRDQECLAAKLCHMGSGQKCGSWSRAREIKESRL